MDKKKIWLQRRRLCEILEAGSAEDPVSRAYDIFSTLMTLTNVIATVLYTFDEMELAYGRALLLTSPWPCSAGAAGTSSPEVTWC